MFLLIISSLEVCWLELYPSQGPGRPGQLGFCAELPWNLEDCGALCVSESPSGTSLVGKQGTTLTLRLSSLHWVQPSRTYVPWQVRPELLLIRCPLSSRTSLQEDCLHHNGGVHHPLASCFCPTDLGQARALLVGISHTVGDRSGVPADADHSLTSLSIVPNYCVLVSLQYNALSVQ